MKPIFNPPPLDNYCTVPKYKHIILHYKYIILLNKCAMCRCDYPTTSDQRSTAKELISQINADLNKEKKKRIIEIFRRWLYLFLSYEFTEALAVISI